MPTPHVTPPSNGTASTWQIGTYNAVTDAWTLVLDLNDRSTWYVKSYDLAQPEKVVSRSGNPRTQGERITNERYKNRYITLTLQLRSTTTLAAIDTAIHSLESALSNTPFMLRLAEAQAAQYSYAVVKSWIHNIPQDPLQRLAMVKTSITLVLECEPFLLGDRLYLDNLVVNPGFEAPSGPAVTAFADTFATTNAYALQAGGAASLSPTNTYVDIVMANGGANLLRYHRLGETSGTVAYDIGGTAQHGATHGTPTQGVAGLISGDTDTCYTLAAASSQYVSSPTTSLPTGNAAISFAAWIKFAANPAGNQFVWAYGATAGGAHNGVSLYIDASGRPNCDVFNGTGTVTGTALALNVPHFLVVTWDGTTLRLYVDGVSVGTPTTPGANTIPTTAIACNFGATSGAVSFFSGQMDEVCVYNAALSAANVSAIYTAGHTGATGTVANSMSLPAAAQVAFGSPAWGALNTWQVRFRWVTGLTASWYLHYTDANNFLKVDVSSAASGYAITQTIAGVAHVLASATIVPTHEAWYWLQVTQFPTVPGDAPFVQASLFYDDAGAIGSAVTNGALGPVATFDAVTALVGRPQIAASGAALAIGGNFASVHTVSLFGPGGWYLSNAGTGLVSAAWEGAQQLGASGTTANTYPSGPVTSYGAGRIDVTPAGTLDARLSTWDGTGAGAGAAQYGIPTAQNHVLGLALAYKTTAGLSATSAVNLLIIEYNSSGTLLTTGTKAILSGVAQTAWTAYSGTYTVSNAATAYVRLQLQVSDSTANSANATVWFDNVQLWDQTANGGQTTMGYCELRSNQSPAQLLVSGLVGDVPAPATVAFGTYFNIAGVTNAPYSFLIGRRSYATSGVQLVAPVTDTFAPGSPTPVLDSTSYGGLYVKWTSPNSGTVYTPYLFNGRPADYQGVAALFVRLYSSETAGTNISKVTTSAVSMTQAAAWEQPVNSGVIYDTYVAPSVAGLTTQNTWTLVNAGMLPLPSFARSNATDLSQNYQTVALNLNDSNAGPTVMRINWGMLLPNDGGAIRGQVQYTGNINGASNMWNWYYIDASPAQGGIVPITAFSYETAALANITHAAGGVGVPPTSVPDATVSIIPTGDPYLTLNPQPPTNALSVSGVNQFGALLTDASNNVINFVASLSYTPRYLDPR